MSVLGDTGLFGFDDDDLSVAEAPKPGMFGPSVGMIVGLFVVAALFGLVAFHASIASNQTQLDHLEQEISNSHLENARLELFVAQMESPVRIVEAAQGRLGMVEPVSITYLTPPVDVVTTGSIRKAFTGFDLPAPAAVQGSAPVRPTALPLVVGE